MDNLKKPPFPWFGGKSKIAHVVWNAFGNVNCYVEPFAGSLAVLLRRPHAPNIEIVNDIDSYLANFWRAISNEPEQVAYWAGQVLISIGAGRGLREVVFQIIDFYQREAYNRGLEAGRKETQ